MARPSRRIRTRRWTRSTAAFRSSIWTPRPRRNDGRNASPACRRAAGGFERRMPGPVDRQADGSLIETPDFIFEQGIKMKKFAIAAALLMISASAHAGTYSYEGVTVHVQDGCRSSSCVSVYAPGYGYYNGGGSLEIRKRHKETARVGSSLKKNHPPPPPPPATPPAVA